MNFEPTKTIEQLGVVAATANLSAREAKMAYADEVSHQLRHWVGKDAPREDAAVALSVWVRRHGLDDEIRGRVLANFDPRPEPAAGKDFLPGSGTEVLGGSVSCTFGCYGGNNDFDCPVHGGVAEVTR